MSEIDGKRPRRGVPGFSGGGVELTSHPTCDYNLPCHTGDTGDGMELATKSSAEVDFRVTEPPGSEAHVSERVSPEASDETRTSGTIPPPYFNL